jgi:hypothetical protein
MKRLFICGAAVAWLVFSVGATGAAPTGASVTGSGKGPFPIAPETGTVQFEVSAHALADGSAEGRFHGVRHLASGGIEAHFEGDVTCLEVHGNTAFITGVATSGKVTGQPDFVAAGQKVAVTIIDNGKNDLFALETSFAPFPHDIIPCQPARTPFATSEEGNFVVHG